VISSSSPWSSREAGLRTISGGRRSSSRSSSCRASPRSRRGLDLEADPAAVAAATVDHIGRSPLGSATPAVRTRTPAALRQSCSLDQGPPLGEQLAQDRAVAVTLLRAVAAHREVGLERQRREQVKQVAALPAASSRRDRARAKARQLRSLSAARARLSSSRWVRVRAARRRRGPATHNRTWGTPARRPPHRPDAQPLAAEARASQRTTRIAISLQLPRAE